MIYHFNSVVYQYLIKHSIRPSVQRTAIMDYLINNRNHPTVDEIYLALVPGMPTLSKTTVYNTLNLFVERGAVQVLNIDEKNARFDINTSIHAHFICSRCGKIQDIFEISPENLEIKENHDFVVAKVEISYHGICKDCLSSN